MFRYNKVLVFPTEEQESKKEKIEIESVVQPLIGVITDVEMTSEELREERRQKYETND